ncbi:MAG: CHAT domain-containing protein [Pleurocapsa sp.]
MRTIQSVVLNLGNGNLNQGFPAITAQVWTAERLFTAQFTGSLPPASFLSQQYHTWQIFYQSLSNRLVMLSPTLEEDDDDELEIEPAGITQVSQLNFFELCQKLQKDLNNWLKEEDFLKIERQLRSQLDPNQEIRVIIESNDDLVKRLPWHQWDFFRDYPLAEMALSKPDYQKPPKSPIIRPKVRILAILGSSKHIDLEQERHFLDNLPDAETEFLIQPSRLEFDRQLWDAKGWDVLFFAGHSQTEGETGRIYLNESQKNNSLTVEQLEEALKAAIDKGLKLAIFNSCDGLGLANALGKLNIPQVIVMREPVPNRVAQEFFKHFLEVFALQRLSLYQSVKQARRKLQGLENEYPGASWLPVICQNPAVESPTWLNLGGIPPCPYRGLFAFREQDTDFFYGRNRFVKDLLAAVNKQSLVAVVGPSGSGKSSVIFAGLIPQLRQDKNIHWQIASFRPGNNPFEALAVALAPLYYRQQNRESDSFPSQSISVVEQTLESKLRPSVKALSQIIQSSVKISSFNSFVSVRVQRFVLVIDQFEELYTLCPKSERQLFLNQLLYTIQHTPAFTLVITLRVDFFGSAISFSGLSNALKEAVYNLSAMNYEELQSAIEQPAAQMQVRLEQGLIDKLISDVWKQPGNLPLLEFALTQLWSRQSNGWLTHQAYAEIGGVELALVNHAEAIYAKLSSQDRQRMQQVFMQLVQLAEKNTATRRLATRDEVKPENWDLVSYLADARLVMTNRNPLTGNETVEIVHEALINYWGRLEAWLQVDGEFRRWQEQLRIATGQWENSDRDRGALLHGKLLADAEYWQQQRFNDLSSQDRYFIEQSLQLQHQERQTTQRRNKLIIFGLAFGLSVSLMLTAMAGWQWRNAFINEIAATSQYAKLLCASSHAFEGLLESLKAGQKIKQVAWIEQNPQLRHQVLAALQETVYGIKEKNRLQGHQGAVHSVNFSPDGKILASAGEDGKIILWNKNGTLLHTLTGHQNKVYSVNFSPDGKILASAGEDGKIILWNKNGTLLHTLTGHQNALRSVQFSPDGKILASAGEDGEIILWNKDGRNLNAIATQQGKIYDLSFSPDGKILASVGEDATLKLWNRAGNLLKTLTNNPKPLLSVSFTPDGQQIVTSSSDGTIAFWSKEGELLKSLLEENVIYRVAFSPDGQIMASVGGDSIIKLWNRDYTVLQSFTGHNNGVLGIAFSSNNNAIATASADGTVKLWQRDNLFSQTLHSHSGGVYSAVFSPDNKTIATAGGDKTAKLWYRDGTLFKTLTGHSDVVHGVSFSPDGKTIVTASWDKTIKLWSQDGTLLKTLTGHSGKVYMASFTPDGTMLVSVSGDGTVKLWSRDGKLLKNLTRHTDVVHGLSISSDSQMIATASHDRTIKLWNRKGKLLKTLTGHTNWVHGVSFSPDGQAIASASHDRTVKLWNRKGKLLNTIIGHTDKVLGVAFSSDGKILASSSRDGSVRLWHLDGTSIATLRGHGNWVHGISFDSNNKILASASYDNTAILWNLEPLDNLDVLLAKGCNWMQDYLNNNPSLKQSFYICN